MKNDAQNRLDQEARGKSEKLATPRGGSKRSKEGKESKRRDRDDSKESKRRDRDGSKESKRGRGSKDTEKDENKRREKDKDKEAVSVSVSVSESVVVLRRRLRRVLLAIARLHPWYQQQKNQQQSKDQGHQGEHQGTMGVGYCQGLNYIGAFVLHMVTPPAAPVAPAAGAQHGQGQGREQEQDVPAVRAAQAADAQDPDQHREQGDSPQMMSSSSSSSCRMHRAELPEEGDAVMVLITEVDDQVGLVVELLEYEQREARIAANEITNARRRPASSRRCANTSARSRT